MANDAKDSHNVTKKDKHLAAASMLAFKLAQEQKLKKTLKPHFKQVGAQVKKAYSNTGKLPSFNKHREAVKGIINDHYIDTATQTSTNLRDGFKPVKNDYKLDAIIADDIENDADERSDFAADSIADTTSNNFSDYIKEAIVGAALTGIVLSHSDIAENISNKFEETSEGRLDLISAMETGIAADDGKSSEIDALQDTDAEFEDGTTIADYKMTKTWIAILDEHTRPAHADADGQEVNYDEPFVVDGEELMEPRDDDLGASDENIMNCRCESVESLE
jgi:hypothetical protein